MANSSIQLRVSYRSDPTQRSFTEPPTKQRFIWAIRSNHCPQEYIAMYTKHTTKSRMTWLRADWTIKSSRRSGPQPHCLQAVHLESSCWKDAACSTQSTAITQITTGSSIRTERQPSHRISVDFIKRFKADAESGVSGFRIFPRSFSLKQMIGNHSAGPDDHPSDPSTLSKLSMVVLIIEFSTGPSINKNMA